MKKISTFIIIILAIVAGTVIYINYSSSENGNKISEQEAVEIAVEAVSNGGGWPRQECVRASAAEKHNSVIIFEMHEIHNASCGGDPQTSPRITSVLVNTKTGEAYDQPALIDTIDQGWRTIRIEGKDYQVTKKLR